VALIVSAIAAAVTTGLAPLADPDLPMHLATGEWIVAHRAVPFTEPFAWTRLGEPFSTYAWPWQTIYFVTLRASGPIGLHLLAAIFGASIVVAGSVAGRALGLSHLAATVFAVLAASVALTSTPFLRPQLVMHTLVMLAWVCLARIAESETPPRRWLVALTALGVLSANTQITFPVLAAPLALLLVRERPNVRALLWAAGALTLGWMLTPYLLTWPELIARLSSGITTHHPIVGELKPGFAVAPFVGLALAALPIAAAPRLRSTRARAIYGTMWLLGLLVFTQYFKGIGAWWWCSIPLCVMVLDQLPTPSTVRVERALAALLSAAMLASTISSVRLFAVMQPFEGAGLHGRLPSVKSFGAEPAVRWLQRNMRAESTGKLLTGFSYGSYLRWRLPTLSQSIDSRGGIFPDSAVLPDLELRRGASALGPWQSADLAIVPMDFLVVGVLNSDPSWQRIGVCDPPPWAGAEPRVGLWVRREWWARAGLPSASPPAGDVLTF
jgi:hypothetical protein